MKCVFKKAACTWLERPRCLAAIYSWPREVAKMRPQLYQGEGFADFKDRKRVSAQKAKKYVTAQAELIAFNIEKELKLQSLRSRRQAISYLLEQCVLLCSINKRERRMRWVLRLVNRARNAVRK